MYFTLMYFTLCTMHLTRCTSLDVVHSDVLHSVCDALHSMYFTLMYFTLCTMHLTRCTSLDVLHSDVLHSVYYTLCTMVCTLDSACIVLYLILCTSLKGFVARKNPSRCFREKDSAQPSVCVFRRTLRPGSWGARPAWSWQRPRHGAKRALQFASPFYKLFFHLTSPIVSFTLTLQGFDAGPQH